MPPKFDGKEGCKQIEDNDGGQTKVDDPLRIHISEVMRIFIGA
jgi:hypothetical protein